MDVITLLVILIFSSILHEVMHGFVADRLGDPTARLLGRLTLNPLKHIDPVWSILVPISLFIASGGTFIYGAAKPVPIDPFNLKEGRKDVALVAFAGPLTNLVLAVTASLFIRFGFHAGFFYDFLYQVIYLNLLLAVFNLVPIPPLDGSKVLALFLSDRLAAEYLSLERYGMFIIFFLLVFPLGGFSLWNVVQHVIFNLQNILLP